MDLSGKLQMKQGERIRLINLPADVRLEVPTSATADGVLAFAFDQTDLAKCKAAIEAARKDHLAWIAYPKAGRLGTNLNRDKLWDLLKGQGIRPVRQVALNDTWSAMRFRPE